MSTFYKTYIALCNEFNTSPSRVALLLGISKTSVTRWEQGYQPTDANLLKLANYFGVTVEYLKGEEKEKKLLVFINEELTEYLQELQSRDEMRMLFKVTKDCTKEEIEQAVRVIEALRKGK